MTHWLHTTRFTRGKLPHWEVTEGRYFVTVRCADSLPGSIVDRLSEIHQTLQDLAPQSEQFRQLQRSYFRIMDKYLDAGTGKCRLLEPKAAGIVCSELASLAEWQIKVSH